MTTATDSVDATRFEEAVARARPLVVTDAAKAAEVLREALGEWRGRPYADLVDVPGLDAEVRRLEDLRLQAVELRIDADLADGHHEQILGEAEALADEYPTRERCGRYRRRRRRRIRLLVHRARRAQGLGAEPTTDHIAPTTSTART
jgi:hypothetical protein